MPLSSARAKRIFDIPQAIQSMRCNDPQLTVANFVNSEIDDACVQMLASALHENTQLIDLNLARNDFGDDGGKYLVAMLRHNSTLRSLSISQNKAGLSTIQALHAMLEDSGNSTLTALDLGFLTFLENDPGEEEGRLAVNLKCEIAQFLVRNHEKHVKNKEADIEEEFTLCLSGQGLGDYGAIQIAQFLMSCGSLRSVDLSSNDIEDDGAEALLSALSVNTTIRTLNLEDNYEFPLETKEKIGALLVRNRALDSLYLGRYRIHEPVLHRSKHSEVSLAEDLSCDGVDVVLKMTTCEKEFWLEISSRDGLDDTHVVGVQGFHLPATDTATHPNFCSEKFRSQPTESGTYCLVLDRAEHTLRHVIENERIAGHDFVVVSSIAAQLAQCLAHLHAAGSCHLDLRQINLMRVGERWKLIDLGSAGMIGTAPTWSRSAYACPEIAALSSSCGGELIHTRMDVWAFGVILFELCSARSFWVEKDNDDELYTDAALQELIEWESIDAERVGHVFRKVDNMSPQKRSMCTSCAPRPTLLHPPCTLHAFSYLTLPLSCPRHIAHIHPPCTPRQEAVDLLGMCLQGDPTRRMQNMQEETTAEQGRSILRIVS